MSKLSSLLLPVLFLFPVLSQAADFNGNDETGSGYYYSSNISSSIAVGCATNGFVGCARVSACEVDGNSVTPTGFRQCAYLSACRVDDLESGGTEYYNCIWRDPDSCD